MPLPRYPIYIISKGRWESRQTSKTLEKMGIPYFIAVEPQEFDKYASVIDRKKILVTPFSNLGKGSIPVRNFVWEHAKANGHKRHWVLDDNIKNFYRLHENTRFVINSGVCFTAIEDFSDRFTNMALSGMQYNYFCRSDRPWDPVIYNTRIYSCILINNEIEQRWRVLEWEGKDAPFNEDTDLALQVLKAGYCTAMFNAFTSGKLATMTMKGGNTDAVYKVAKDGFDNRYTFAASLQKAHPDCVKIQQIWGRWHHDVDFTRFQRNNFPILAHDADVTSPYPHKLKLVKLNDDGSQTDVNVKDVTMEVE